MHNFLVFKKNCSLQLTFCDYNFIVLQAIDDNEFGRRATIALAFRLMLTGRPELLIQAGTILPTSTRYDTPNQAGLTALMIASIRNDEAAMQQLLDANADPNVEVPAIGITSCMAIHPGVYELTYQSRMHRKLNLLVIQ